MRSIRIASTAIGMALLLATSVLAKTSATIDADDPGTWFGYGTQRQAIQYAVNTLDVVVLEGVFDLGISYTPGYASVFLNKGVVVKGKDRDGQKAKITGGHFAFIVGSAVPPDGDILIQNLHFESNGGCSVYVKQLSEGRQCSIRKNDFTDDLWVTFGGIDETALPDANAYWKYNGSTWVFETIQFNEATIESGAGPNSALIPFRLFFNPTPGIMEWFHFPILLGGSSAPYGVKGNVTIEDNYINPEEGGLPAEFQKVFYGVFGVHTIANDSSSLLLIERNTILNCSARGVTLLDHLGTAKASQNEIVMGMLDQYHLGVVGAGIGAYYAFFNLPYNGNPTPAVGGIVTIKNNRVKCGTQIGIGLGGIGGRTWSPGCEVVNNRVTLANTNPDPNVSSTGLYMADVSSAHFTSNSVEGEGSLALKVGRPIEPGYPLPTEQNWIVGLKAQGFHSTQSADPGYDGIDVLFSEDAIDNRLVGFVGDGQVVDLTGMNSLKNP